MVSLSATDRESTRDLLAKIAERLAVRWEEAATVPSFADGEDKAGDASDADGEAESQEATPELTSLGELLGWSRRGRAARA